MEGIAVGLGPGSFTGLRVGIASARALGASTGLPLSGVCTLDALALGLAEARRRAAATALAVLDARRGEAFAALYSAVGRAALGALGRRPGGARRAARGARPTPPWPPVRGRYDFAMSWRIEEPRCRTTRTRCTGSPPATSAPWPGAGTAAGEALAPIYLRPPDAERWRERDNSQKTG